MILKLKSKLLFKKYQDSSSNDKKLHCALWSKNERLVHKSLKSNGDSNKVNFSRLSEPGREIKDVGGHF